MIQIELEEPEQAIRALKADNVYCAIWDMKQYLRRLLKNGDTATVEHISDQFDDFIYNNGINLDSEWA